MKKIFINYLPKQDKWNFVEFDEDKKTSCLYAIAKGQDQFDLIIDQLIEKGKLQ